MVTLSMLELLAIENPYPFHVPDLLAVAVGLAVALLASLANALEQLLHEPLQTVGEFCTLAARTAVAKIEMARKTARTYLGSFAILCSLHAEIFKSAVNFKNLLPRK